MAQLPKSGRYRLTKDEESALVKDEQLRRRNLRIEEVRLQSRCIAANVRQRVQQKKKDEIDVLKRKVCPEVCARLYMAKEETEWECKLPNRNKNKPLVCSYSKPSEQVEKKDAEEPERRELEEASAATPEDIDTPYSPMSTSNWKTPKVNHLARALAEMSEKEKHLSGYSMSPQYSPRNVVMPPLRVHPVQYSRTPLAICQESPEKKLKDRVTGAVTKEQRRKNVLKLLEELDKIERESRYSDCKENMQINVTVDTAGDNLKALILEDTKPAAKAKQEPRNEAPGHIRLERTVPLSSPRNPLLRHALVNSLKKAPTECVVGYPFQSKQLTREYSGSPGASVLGVSSLRTPTQCVIDSPYQSKQFSPEYSGTSEASTSADSGVTDTDCDEQPMKSSDTLYTPQFENVTLRRAFRTRALTSPALSDSPGSVHDSGASLCTSASGNSSNATSATSYMSLPEGFGLAKAEACIQQWRQENTAQRERLTPALYFKITEREQIDLAAGKSETHKDTPEYSSPEQSPGCLDTAFMEVSPFSGQSPSSQGSSHGLRSLSHLSSPQDISSTHYTWPAWQCEPEGSPASFVVDSCGNISESREDTDSFQYSETDCGSDSSPGGLYFCGLSPGSRPPLIVRTLANQEVLIPHQLSTIAEIDTSACSKSSSGSSRRLSEEGKLHESSTPSDSTTLRSFQSMFMGLEQKIDAAEADLRAMRNSVSQPPKRQMWLPSLTEETILMNVAQPTLVDADFSCAVFEQLCPVVIHPPSSSPLSDSLLSFMKHEASFAHAEAAGELLFPSTDSERQ